jgi:hypothetical protein
MYKKARRSNPDIKMEKLYLMEPQIDRRDDEELSDEALEAQFDSFHI